MTIPDRHRIRDLVGREPLREDDPLDAAGAVAPGIDGERPPCPAVSHRMGEAVELLDPYTVAGTKEVDGERGLRWQHVARVRHRLRGSLFNLGRADIQLPCLNLHPRTKVPQKFLLQERPWCPRKRNRLLGRAVGRAVAPEQPHMGGHRIEHRDPAIRTPVPQRHRGQPHQRGGPALCSLQISVEVDQRSGLRSIRRNPHDRAGPHVVGEVGAGSVVDHKGPTNALGHAKRVTERDALDVHARAPAHVRDGRRRQQRATGRENGTTAGRQVPHDHTVVRRRSGHGPRIAQFAGPLAKAAEFGKGTAG